MRIMFLKGYVKSHMRRLASGREVQVNSYHNKVAAGARVVLARRLERGANWYPTVALTAEDIGGMPEAIRSAHKAGDKLALHHAKGDTYRVASIDEHGAHHIGGQSYSGEAELHAVLGEGLTRKLMASIKPVASKA